MTSCHEVLRHSRQIGRQISTGLNVMTKHNLMDLFLVSKSAKTNKVVNLASIVSISIKAHSQLSTKLAIVGTPNSPRVSAIFTDSNHLRAKDVKLENVMVVALLVLVVVAIIATIVCGYTCCEPNNL